MNRSERRNAQRATSLAQRSEAKAHRIWLRRPPTYSAVDMLNASDAEPMPLASRVHQLSRMYLGLRAIETADAPDIDDWRVCSDAVNLMETLIAANLAQDSSGLLADAVAALANAGRRHRAGGQIRLDGAGIVAVRAVLEDYATVLAQLPHRTMIGCHRATEKRIRAILSGHRQPHDIEVMDL